MKKKLLLISAAFILLFTTSCTDSNTTSTTNTTKTVDKYKGKSGTVTCNYELKTQEINFKGMYKLTYEDGIIVKTYTREITTVDTESSASDYYEKIKADYLKYDDVDYYEYDINMSGKKITTSSSIDYKKVNKEMLSTLSGEEISDKNLKVSKTVATYKIMGATCEEE